MTVSTEISSNEYIGNGVTTDFDYKFRIFKANQLSVITSDADGDNVVTLRLGTDYTVTGANKSAGGKVILTKPLADKHQISISRDIPITQETSFRNQSKFFAETHEDAFDYLTMIIQRIWGSLGSLYLKRPSILANWFDAKGYRIANLGKPKRDSDAVDLGTLKDEIEGVNSTILQNEKRLFRVDDMDISALPKAKDRAGNVITFDKDGKPIVVAPASGSAVDVLNQLSKGDGSTLIGSTNYTGIRDYTGSNNKITVYGINNIFDGAGGLFVLDLLDTSSQDNNGTVLVDKLGRRWKRQYVGAASVRWFGAAGNGVTDDRLAIQTAISSCDEVHGFDSEYYIGETSTDKNEYLLSIKGTKNKIIKLNVAFKDNFHVHSDNPNAAIAILDGCIGSGIEIKAREISSNTDYGASSVSAVHIECHERDITNTTVKVEAIRCLAGLTAWAPDSAKCERLTVDISTTGCHYGLRAVTNINYIFGNVKSHIVRRTVFLADVYNASINSQSSLNYQVNDILIKSYGKTVSNIVINHNQSDSSSTEWPVVIESQYGSPVSFRAIEVNLNTNKSGEFQTLNKGMFSIASRNADSSIKEYSDDTFVDIKLRLNGSFRRNPAYKKTQLLNIRSIMTTRPVFDVEFDIKNHDLKRSTAYKSGKYISNYVGKYSGIATNNLYVYAAFTDDFDCVTVEVKGCSSLSTESEVVFYAKYVLIVSNGSIKNMNLIHNVRMQELVGNINFEKSGHYLLLKSFDKTTLFENQDSYVEISILKN